MPDEITPPGGSASTPDAPVAVAVAGAATPPADVIATYDDPSAVSLDLSAAASARIRLGSAENLATLTIAAAPAGLEIKEIVLPDGVDSLVIEDGPSAGDWLDALIAALPDRSAADDGTYDDVAGILNQNRTDALGAKGYLEAV